MPVERTSILKRPIRAPNPLSEESADKQYQAELAKLQAKRDRYQNTQTFLKQMLNPSKPEKREFQYVSFFFVGVSIIYTHTHTHTHTRTHAITMSSYKCDR